MRFRVRWPRASQPQKPSRPEPEYRRIGKEFQKQRQQRKRVEQLRGAQNRLHRYARAIVVAIIALAVVGAVVAFGAFLSRSETVVLKQLKFFGNQAIASADLQTALDKYVGQSLVSLNTRSIESELLNSFPYIRSVFVRKVLPDGMEVEVVERFPVLIYTGMATSVAIDADRRVLNVYYDQDIPSLTEQEILILDGFGDRNAKLVQDKYIALLPEDERPEDPSELKWEEVKEADKARALQVLRREIETRIENQVRTTHSAAPDRLVTELPVLGSYEVDRYQVGNTFPQEKFELAVEIGLYVKDRKLTMRDVLWRTDFNIVLTLTSGTRIFLTSIKPIADQLDALDTLQQVEQQEITKLKEIDLRGELIAVR